MSAARISSPAPESCAACGEKLSPWIWAQPQEAALEREYLLMRCAACGSAATAGEPAPELYETGVYSAGAPRFAAAVEAMRRLYERQRLGFLRPWLAPPARILDAGAGQGRFVVAARNAGYRADGFEPSEAGVAIAAARGISLVRTTLERAELAAEGYDGVTLSHVLEHLEMPATALARVHEFLRPGGYLLVGVPNIASVQAQIGGGRWLHLDVPRHRHHFSPRGLRDLLGRTGFEPVATHQVLLEHNPFGMWQSWLDRATSRPAYAYNLVKRNAPLSLRDLVPTLVIAGLAPLAVLTEVAAGAAGRGGTMVVVARRR